MSAEGGSDPFAFKDKDLDEKLDEKDEEESEEGINTRLLPNPPTYTPSGAYHQGEQDEMTNLDERSRLPDVSLDENIPLLDDFIHPDDKPGILARALDFIKRRFPNVNFGKIDPIGFSKKPGNETEIVSFGKKGLRLAFSRKTTKVY